MIEAVRVDADELGPREWCIDGDDDDGLPVLAVAIDPETHATMYLTPCSSGTLREDTEDGTAVALLEPDGRVVTECGSHRNTQSWLDRLNRRDALRDQRAAA